TEYTANQEHSGSNTTSTSPTQPGIFTPTRDPLSNGGEAEVSTGLKQQEEQSTQRKHLVVLGPFLHAEPRPGRTVFEAGSRALVLKQKLWLDNARMYKVSEFQEALGPSAPSPVLHHDCYVVEVG
ncbi:MAG: hypothetical protein QXQ90_08905, partial [Desulfurococcaceae archaeon]